MIKTHRLALSFLILVSLSTVTSATTLFVDESASTAYTTVNGLDWLDLPTTAGLSLVYLQANYLNDWDIATAAQYQSMIFSLTGLASTQWWLFSDNATRANFVDLFGDTGGGKSVGFYQHSAGNWLAGGCQPSNQCYLQLPHTYFIGDADVGQLGRSTFLVRSALVSVPEPSIIALLGFGLVGLGFARRRRQAE